MIIKSDSFVGNFKFYPSNLYFKLFNTTILFYFIDWYYNFLPLIYVEKILIPN